MNQKLGRLPPDLYTHIGKKKSIPYSCCEIYNVEERMSPFCSISMISARERELIPRTCD